jgi:cytosine/adenosine deaminase-related metal-dependent hydrolase
MVKGKWPLTALYSPEDAYLGQLAGALECINAGVTTVLDHFHLTTSPAHVESAVQASIDCHMRIIFAYARISTPTSINPYRTNNEEDTKWQIKQIEQLAKTSTFAPGGLLRLGFAYDTLGIGNLQDHLPLFTKIRELGIKHITSHSVPQFAHSQGGTSRLQRWIDGQLLSSAVTFSHSNYLSDCDLELLAKHGCGIGSTPEYEMGMSHGDPIVFSALNKGVKVGLGVDCTSIVSGDFFSAMRHCLQSERGRIHAKLWNEKGKGARYVRPRAEDILRVATLGGAEAVHLDDEIGSIEEGKRADLIVVRTDTPAMCGADQVPDPIRAFVFNASVADVDMVIVDGRILKENGRVLGWTKEVHERVKNSTQRIWKEYMEIPMKQRDEEYQAVAKTLDWNI